MSIADQNIGKLHHYEVNLDREFSQIYHFLQFSLYTPDSIDGSALKLGSVTQNRLRPPIAANAIILDDAFGQLRISSPQALGGGAVATLGTIGGSGPTAAAQVEWLEIEVNGVPRFVATWA